MTDETPSAFIRQISLKNHDPLKVDPQLCRLSSAFDSCFLCLIVVPWRKASQCRNNGVTGKGDVVFEVVMKLMRYELLSMITSTYNYVKELKAKVVLLCFIFGTKLLKSLK